ncbi:hypothetical protein X759_12660 [Mesorhizobium sp. LSHC420B00]|nr:hypothetical protein X759_12660 [Mesorhizobium sp. LSHC420B00]
MMLFGNLWRYGAIWLTFPNIGRGFSAVPSSIGSTS